MYFQIIYKHRKFYKNCSTLAKFTGYMFASKFSYSYTEMLKMM